jgi:uncharacterized membrane protein YccF (DUF307 family)
MRLVFLIWFGLNALAFGLTFYPLATVATVFGLIFARACFKAFDEMAFRPHDDPPTD